MSAHKGYYSLIQYCPNRSRMETRNVGVALLCPDLGFLDAKATRSNGGLKALCHGQSYDLRAIETAKNGIVERIRNSRDEIRDRESFEHFIGTRANDFLLTPPRPIVVEKPEADLANLFADLVDGGEEEEGQARGARRPMTQVNRLFKPLVAKNRLVENVAVMVPAIDWCIQARYGYRNGHLNLIMPTVFSGQEGSAMNLAVRLGGEEHLLEKHKRELAEECHIIVIPSVRGSRTLSDLEARVSNTMKDFGVEVVSVSELEDFAQRIEQEGRG